MAKIVHRGAGVWGIVIVAIAVEHCGYYGPIMCISGPLWVTFLASHIAWVLPVGDFPTRCGRSRGLEPAHDQDIGFAAFWPTGSRIIFAAPTLVSEKPHSLGDLARFLLSSAKA